LFTHKQTTSLQLKKRLSKPRKRELLLFLLPAFPCACALKVPEGFCLFLGQCCHLRFTKGSYFWLAWTRRGVQYFFFFFLADKEHAPKRQLQEASHI
ncbi:hypothetical protein K457DRAFT_34666, partial [Linnemannia elongata AG-77]